MIRTIVTPDNENISVHIPPNYIGKPIEILLYPVDELIEEKPIKGLAAKFRGALKLSDEEYNDFQNYLKEVRM